MTILAWFRSMLTRSAATAALMHKGSPVTGEMAMGRWHIDSTASREALRATVSFGPFPAPADFDSVALLVADTAEIVPLADTVHLGAGMTFSYDLELRFALDPL